MFKTATFTLFCLLFSSLVRYQFSTLLYPYSNGSSFIKELLIYGGQFLIQILILSYLVKQNSIAYINAISTISLFGAIFLVCPLTVNFFWDIPSFYYLIYFGLVIFMMIEGHKKNVTILRLPKLLNLSWIFYSILWIPIINNLP